MKRFCSVLLILCLLLSLCACGQSEPAQNAPETTTAPPTTQAPTYPTYPTGTESTITPVLYQVTDADGNTAWLFGSIHVGQEYFFPLPEYVTSAYENSDALAVECDVVSLSTDTAAQTKALMKMIYMDGTRISDHIPEDLYTQAVEALEGLGIYSPALDLYCPALWASLIEASMYETMDLSTELGIDMYFLNNALQAGKEIQEVESAEFQYSLMANYSLDLQIMLLESAIHSCNNIEEASAQLKELTDAWATGNEDTLVTLLNDEGEITSEEEAILYEEYTNAMITQRNISMADFAESALSSGKEVFICVGAAHVVGPGAMADLLTQRGYTVERIEA